MKHQITPQDLEQVWPFILLWLWLTILLIRLCSHRPTNYKKDFPPPEWIIVKDGEGYFGAKFPNCNYVIWKNFDDKLMTTWEQACERAWKQYLPAEDRCETVTRENGVVPP